MPKYFVKNEQINQNQIDILGQDVNHIKNVLRMRIGDTLELCNCDTQENYNCEIVNIEKKKIQCEILEKNRAKSRIKCRSYDISRTTKRGQNGIYNTKGSRTRNF